MTEPTALTIVAGRRGSGKSSVVDRLGGHLPAGSVVLCDGHDRHDHLDCEVQTVEQEILFGAPGLASCALRGDLLEAVDDLLGRRDPPPHVVIEAVAGTDVAIVVQTFLRTARLRRHVRIGGLVAVVDAHALATAGRAHPAGAATDLDDECLAMADLVVVNRIDRLVPAVGERTTWDIWSRNGLGRIHLDDDRSGDDPLPSHVLGLAGYDLAHGTDLRRNPPPTRLTPPTPPPGEVRHKERQLSGGDAPIRHVSIALEGRLERDALDEWLDRLHDGVGDDLLRWRGDSCWRGSDDVGWGKGFAPRCRSTTVHRLAMRSAGWTWWAELPRPRSWPRH